MAISPKHGGNVMLLGISHARVRLWNRILQGISQCECGCTLPSKPIMHRHSSHDTSFTLEHCTSQQADQTTSKLLAACSQANNLPCGHKWHKEPLKRYVQIWNQLRVCDCVLYRHYKPNLVSEAVTVPILPASLHHQALLRNHDGSMPGHQGWDKTLERLRQEA